MRFIKNPVDGVRLETFSEASAMFIVVISPGGIYRGLEFKLLIKAGKEYPFKPPSIYLTDKVPLHPHILSCGSIRINLLQSTVWSPAMNLQSTVVAIVNMLSSIQGFKEGDPNLERVSGAPSYVDATLSQPLTSQACSTKEKG